MRTLRIPLEMRTEEYIEQTTKAHVLQELEVFVDSIPRGYSRDDTIGGILYLIRTYTKSSSKEQVGKFLMDFMYHNAQELVPRFAEDMMTILPSIPQLEEDLCRLLYKVLYLSIANGLLELREWEKYVPTRAVPEDTMSFMATVNYIVTQQSYNRHDKQRLLSALVNSYTYAQLWSVQERDLFNEAIGFQEGIRISSDIDIGEAASRYMQYVCLSREYHKFLEMCNDIQENQPEGLSIDYKHFTALALEVEKALPFWED